MLATTSSEVLQVTTAPESFYTEFQIPKGDGSFRTIRPPRRRLREFQRLILRQIYNRVEARSCLHGGIRNRSIFTHAKAHVGKNMVATLDIRKFFPSTTVSHVLPVLEALGFVGQACADLQALVMLDGQLPQGSPTSSILANLAFAQGDSMFIALCKRHRLSYSRYVDDIAISGAFDFRHMRGALVNIIESCNYNVAPEKIRFMNNGVRQVVTGLVVNQNLRPTREFIANLNHDVRACLRDGPQQVADAEGLTVRELQRRLTGRANHVAQADQGTGKRLFGKLCGVNWRTVKVVSRSPRNGV